MIEHPTIWFDNFYKYILLPKEPSYGDLCVLSSNATTEAKESYNKYIQLIKKYIQSWDCLIFENLRIIGVDKEKLAEYTPKGREQLDILFELIDSGVIDNDPFIKLNRP